jgi:type III secretion protein C
VGDGAAASTAAAYPGAATTGNTVEKLRSRGLRRYGAQEAQEAQANAAPQPSVTRADAAPPVNRTGARIAADRTLNAVIVRDRADAMPMYEQLIAELDKAPQLIEIQVTIIEVDRNRLSDIGVDWRYQDGRTTAQAGGGGGITPDLGGLLFNTVIGDLRRFLARINALAADGAARITSRPQVLTISNMEALVSDDKSFYVRVAGQQDVDLFNVTAGTSLRVTPFVVGDAASPQVRLTVTIEDGAISGQAAVDGIPAVDRSSLNTQAVVGSGQNLLLGGLVRERDERRVDKVPLLGDAPVIGPLFRRTVENHSRTERLYLITPRVLPPQANGAAPSPSRDPSGARPLQPPPLTPQSPSTQPVLAPTEPALQAPAPTQPRARPFMDLEPTPVVERGRG